MALDSDLSVAEHLHDAQVETAVEPSSPRLMRDMMVVALATTITNVAAYVLSMSAAWVLPAGEFGALGALLGIAIIGSTAANATQAFAARRVAVVDGSSRAAVAESVLRTSWYAALIVGAVGLAVAWPIAVALNTTMIAVVAAIWSVAVLTYGFGVLGVSQGREENVRFGTDYATIGIGRAAGAVTAMLIHQSATSACIGMLIGAVAGVALVASRRPDRGVTPGVLVGARKELTRNVISMAGLMALINLDVVLARISLPEESSADYAVGSLVSKIAFFMPLFLSLVLFARMSAAKDRKSHALALIGTMALGAFTVTVTHLLAEPILRIVAGPDYVSLAGTLWLFAAQGAIFAVVQSTIYSRLSSEDRGAAGATWIACAVFVVVVLSATGDSLEDILTTSVVVGVALMTLGMWTELKASSVTSTEETKESHV